MEKFELKPIYNRQKSFYKKATVYTSGSNSTLQSYDTKVCSIINGVFVRHWSGYSVTTMNHVNEYRQQNGLDTLSKSEWLSIPCKAWSFVALNNITVAKKTA